MPPNQARAATLRRRIERFVALSFRPRTGGQMQLDLPEHREKSWSQSALAPTSTPVDRLNQGIDVGFRPAGDLQHPAEQPEAAASASRGDPNDGVEHRVISRRDPAAP